MDTTQCFTRTALGSDELKHPKLGLRPRCRQLLFVLDGHLSVEKLHLTLSGITDLEGTLADMLKLGLICDSGMAAPLHAHATPATAQHDDLAAKLDVAMHHSADTADRFENAKHHAVDMMIALFGAKSSHVDKLAQAKDQTEFLVEVGKCKKILGAVASASKAQSFEQSVMAALQK